MPILMLTDPERTNYFKFHDSALLKRVQIFLTFQIKIDYFVHLILV